MFLIEQWRIPILSDSCKNCMAESAKQTVLDESFEMAETTVCQLVHMVTAIGRLFDQELFPKKRNESTSLIQPAMSFFVQ
jgi:hypothetical protein